MLVILAIVLGRSCTYIKRGSSRWHCVLLIAATAFYVAMDAMFIAASLDETCPVARFQTVVFVFYIAYVLLPFVWHLFVRSFVGSSSQPFLRWYEFIPLIILLGMVVASVFTGCLWSIDETGTYIRGPLFDIYTFLNFFYYVEPFIYAAVMIARGQHKSEPYLARAVLFSFVPLLAAAINSFVIPVYQIFPFQPFCSVMVVLGSYFFMASKQNDIIAQGQKEQIEIALAKSQDAERKAIEASKVKSSFLSNMSHDIRTPMNAIINLTELARKEDDAALVKEYLDKMAVSEQFLLTLINDILDVNRIESGVLEFNKEKLTCTDFMKSIDSVVAPLMEAKHLHYHSDFDHDEYVISVDKMRLDQIFFNLLSNAAKFTPEGGDVWFSVKDLEVEGDKLKIQFIVRDNGIGMSEEFQQRLFEPFAREHSQLNSGVAGTGLGLAIVKNLVEAMGGTITVKSKLGEGSEFTVVLCADFEARDESSNKTPDELSKDDSSLDLAGLKVLLVEDNELNAYVAKTIIESFGCVVTVATNGQEAVDAFKNSEPFAFDLICMDIRMPIMDGFEATEHIRALDRADSKSIPIIAMTADVFEEERKHTREAGMNYHLSKPVDADSIYKALKRCMRKANK